MDNGASSYRRFLNGDDEGIVAVGVEFFKALQRQAAKAHLEEFAGEDVVKIIIQTDQML